MNGFYIGTALAIVAGIFLFKSLKAILKIAANIVVGAVLLYVFNYVGAGFDIHIPLTFFNFFIVGLLGVPGIVLLAFLTLL